MKLRTASRFSVLVLAVLIVLTIALFGIRQASGQAAANQPGTSATGLAGTDLGERPAPDFRLRDQFGEQVSLSQFKGKPVILTFMYTHCPDVCPLMANQLHTVMLNLGSDAQHVAVIAISVDPKNDTVASALAFSRLHHMDTYWHFLVGTQNQLAPVWSSYAIDAQPENATVSMHTSVLYVIDKQGRERALLDQSFTNAQMIVDLKTLLKEPA